MLLGCPHCGTPALLLRIETPIPVTVTQTSPDPFDPDGYTGSEQRCRIVR